eukprot:SAG31_NODE_739_length_12444_cov_14.976831_2_plen_932_part_00
MALALPALEDGARADDAPTAAPPGGANDRLALREAAIANGAPSSEQPPSSGAQVEASIISHQPPSEARPVELSSPAAAGPLVEADAHPERGMGLVLSALEDSARADDGKDGPPTWHNSEASEVAAAWLALTLVVASVLCALMLVIMALFNITNARWTYQDRDEYRYDLLDMFRLFHIHELPGELCVGQETTLMIRAIRPKFENMIGLAPGWMRGTLLSFIGVRLVARLLGFGGQSQSQPSASTNPANLQASARLTTSDELFASLQPDIAAAVAERLDRAERTLREREAEHKRELQQAQANAGLCGLLRLVLIGNSLKPAPRVHAGWTAVTDDSSVQSTWNEARDSLGMTVQQAVGVSMARLLLWHWSQPMAFLFVFLTYFCELEPIQVSFGMLVAAREMIYLGTTLAGILVCPVYLLLDVTTVWAEIKGESRAKGYWRLAVYILTPHNYLALCLSAQFSEHGAPWQSRHCIKMGAFGCFICLVVVPVGLFLNTELVKAYKDPHHVRKLDSFLGIKAGIYWRYWLFLGVGFCLGLLNVFLFLVAQRNVRMKRRAAASQAAGVVGMELEDTRRADQWQMEKKGCLSRSFLALAVAQILADFSSCFALGLMLPKRLRAIRVVSASNHAAPTAMLWGYGITAFGFLFLFGPASVVASFKYAASPTLGQQLADVAEEERGLVARLGNHCNRLGAALQRVVAGFFGVAMLLGLAYITVGAVLLVAGNDLLCMRYTGTSEREWQATCGSPESGHCVSGKCACNMPRGNSSWTDMPAQTFISSRCYDMTTATGALLGFKASGNGIGLQSWVEGGDPCAGAWFGIECIGRNGVFGGDTRGASNVPVWMVTTLSLGPNRNVPSILTGDISPLTVLVRLTSLDLSGTSIRGPIPDSLGRLTALTTLKLPSKIAGTIPDSLGRLTGLSGDLDLGESMDRYFSI